MVDLLQFKPYEKSTEVLPFRVCPVNTDSQLKSVLELRKTAYAKHSGYLDSFKEGLDTPDAQDLSSCAITLVAICKETQALLGTVRITASLDSSDLLPPETPADECTEMPFAFIDRFAIKSGAHPLVFAALIKAVWLWALGRDTRWIVGLAAASLARHYNYWGGLSIRGGGRAFIVEKDLAEPVYLVAASASEAQRKVLERNPEFANYFLSKIHPDINVMGQPLPWTTQ